jgi:hypothetical protein
MKPIVSRAIVALTGAAMALGAAPMVAAQAPARAVSLSNDPQEAGLTCFYAAVVTGGGKIEAAAEASWFLFDLTRQQTEGSPETFVDRLEEAAGLPPPNIDTLAADAPALVPLCASRYPLISSKRVVTLPSDPFTREMQCFALTSYLAGMAESELEDSGESAFGKRVAALADTLAARLTEDRAKAAGIADAAAMQQVFARSLRDISPLGNPMKVLEACEAAQ